jgi:iron complex outermembrane receptor protein
MRVSVRIWIALVAISVVGGTPLARALAADAASDTTATTTTTAASPSDATVGEVVVTGSMFRRTTIETASPITTISSEQLKAAGITTISDAIRSLSADNSGSIPTAFGDGFAAGSSGVALRGLTVNSTVVLIDGLRTANYPLADDGERGFVDLNSIPESVLDHAEVLKDGASSLYGADAIAGVVNLVLKPSFQGVDASAEVGDSQHGGGATRNFNLTVGHGDLSTDRYNAYVNVEYEKDDRITVGQRGFPFNTFNLTSVGGDDLNAGDPPFGVGSTYGSVTPARLTTPGDPTTGKALKGAVSQPLRPCGTGSTQETDSLGNVYCDQNQAIDGDDQPSQQRFGAYGRFTVQLTDNIQAYFSGSFYENKVELDGIPPQIQNSTPNNTNSIALPARLANGSLNPNDPFAALGEAALINYAFGDIGTGALENNHVYRFVLGLKGSTAGWDYNFGGVVSHSSLDTVNNGFINYPQLISDIENGTYNFIDPSANSAATREALAPPLTKTSTSDLDSVDISASHNLFQLPGGQLRLGFGGQVRYEANDDPDLNPGDEAQGLGIAHTIGHHTVLAAFGELDAPVIKQVDIDLSGRYDHYSDAGGAFSPKAGVKWTVAKELALRATVSRGFRAPSFAENGSSAAEGFITYSLPASYKAAHGGDGYTLPYSLAELTTANPDIKPETSTSYTVGTVFEPRHYFSISIDYYDIRKSNVIVQSDPSVILADYFAGLPLPANSYIIPDVPDPAHPSLLPRPSVVASPYINADSLVTNGMDIDMRVKFDLPLDIKVTSDVNWTDIFHFLYSQSGEKPVDYVGTQSPYNLSSGAGTPKYRATWTTSFDYKRLNVTTTVYYTSSIKEYALDISPGCFSTNAEGADIPLNCTVPSFVDLDVTTDYKINDKLDLFADMENALDTNPPFDPLNYAGVNYNPTYNQAGIIGRFFKIGVHAKF